MSAGSAATFSLCYRPLLCKDQVSVVGMDYIHRDKPHYIHHSALMLLMLSSFKMHHCHQDKPK